MWLLVHCNLFGQSFDFECLPEGSAIQESEISNCPFGDLSQEEMDALPEVIVYINIHYIKGNYGNFYPGNSNGDLKDGNYYGHLMVNHANNDFKNLIPSPSGLSHKIGDSRIRYVLYTNPNEPADLYGGIWYWDQEPNVFPYPNVMNIVMFNGGPNDELKGTACGQSGCCTRLTTIGAYYHVWKNSVQPKFGHWAFAQLLNHEFLHTLGLCHSFSIINPCKDINPAVECKCGPGTTTCGGPAYGCCSWNGNSTNIMNYAPTLKSLSMCQWGTAYNNAISKNCPFLTFCETQTEPLIIEAGSIITWDHLMIIDRPVIVMPTASLIITCEARFSTEAYVEVRRGAKLTVDGALLTNLCPDGFWPGIQVWGNPSKLQPDPANGINGINDAGIVQVINGATIQHARTAISTGAWAQGGSVAWSHFGGAIYCENSSFIDNRRGVEFMKYIYPNKSKFINCTFSESGNYVDNSVGVTIWECNDITFNRNTFRFLDVAGIFGVDFGAKIYDHNQFWNLPTGIESYNTLFYKGNLDIGQNNSNPNYFKNNTRHIYCASGNGLDRVNIINNDLFNATGNGIIIEGSCHYRIENNRFRNIPLAVVSDASGDDHNLIKCNQFDKHENGILFRDINFQTQFLDNCFPENIDIGVVVNPGASIRSEQGDNSRVANNCLQSKVDIYVPSPFSVFDYFSRQQPGALYCDPHDIYCETPSDNLSDGGFNNYYLHKIKVNTSINCSDNKEEQIVPTLSITEARSKIYFVSSLLNLYPQNTTLQNEFQLATNNLNSLIKDTISTLLESNLYQEAIQLLNPEQSEFELRLTIGLYLMIQNFEQAEELLRNILASNEKLTTFKNVQLTNIKRLREKWNFKPNDIDFQNLKHMADSKSPDRIYAKALLALETGKSQAGIYSPSSIPLNERNNKTSLNEQNQLELFPNPVSGILNVKYNNKLIKASRFEIYNLLGIKIKTGNLDHSGNLKLNFEKFPNGIYIFNLLDSRGNITSKIRFIVKQN